MMMMRLLSAMGIMSLAFGQMLRVALRAAAAASTHPIHMRSLGISLYIETRCGRTALLDRIIALLSVQGEEDLLNKNDLT